MSAADVRAQALEESAAVCDKHAADFDRMAKDARKMADSDASMRQAWVMADEKKHLAMRMARKIRALAEKA